MIEVLNVFDGTVVFTSEVDYLCQADLRGADLQNADLPEVHLPQVDLSDSMLNEANLSMAYLREANLRGIFLIDADLRGANLTGANLTNAELIGANLTRANLDGANLTRVNFDRANLTEVNLKGADLTGASLRRAVLVGTDLTAADLGKIKEDFWSVLDKAPNEVSGLRSALVLGNVDGGRYEGACACLIGTIANLQEKDFDCLPNLNPDAQRPAEKWFFGIQKGDTPKISQITRITIHWIDVWMAK